MTSEDIDIINETITTPTTTTISQQQKRRNTILGSLSVALASFLFATNDAIFKLSGYKESELLTGRFIVQYLWAVSWWICKKPLNSNNWYGDKPDILNTWIRGILVVIHICTVWYAMVLLQQSNT